jgi:hypothetical protein
MFPTQGKLEEAMGHVSGTLIVANLRQLGLVQISED